MRQNSATRPDLDTLFVGPGGLGKTGSVQVADLVRSILQVKVAEPWNPGPGTLVLGPG